MKIDDIRLAKSALTDEVFIGKPSKDGTHWVGNKKNVTSDFLKAIVDVYGGYKAIISGSEGRKWMISVEEVKE